MSYQWMDHQDDPLPVAATDPGEPQCAALHERHTGAPKGAMHVPRSLFAQ